MNNELPAIASSTYTAAPLNMAGIGIAVGREPDWVDHAGLDRARRIQAPSPNEVKAGLAFLAHQAIAAPAQQKEPTMRRLVQVLIADPNENVPTADCLLYKGEPVLTDATDQELYFDIDIKSILAAHNEKRVKLVDKKIKDRTEHLEPAKVRDLKMVVVTIATF